MAGLPPDAPLGPPPPGQTTNFQDPVDQQHYDQYMATMGIFLSLATLSVLLRLGARALIVRRAGWDDVCAFIAMVLNLAHSGFEVQEVYWGLVDYDWNVEAQEWMKNDWAEFNRLCAVSNVFYYLAYCFVKFSILAFYLRILGPSYKRLRIAVWVMFAIIGLMFLGFLIAEFADCNPPSKLFNPETPGTCRPIAEYEVVWFVQALLSAVSDFFILIPMIPFIWRLQMARGRKIGMVFIFCIGFVVTGIAMYRTVQLSYGPFEGYIPPDPLANQFQQTYYTLLEINLAVFVINLPALSQLWVRLGLLCGRKAPRKQRDQEVGAEQVGPNPIDPSPENNGGARNAPRKAKRSPTSQIVYALYSGIGRSRSYDDNRSSNDHDESESSAAGVWLHAQKSDSSRNGSESTQVKEAQ